MFGRRLRLTFRFASTQSDSFLALLALSFLLWASPAAAQDKVDLRGRVVEMGTGRPLVGAEVGLPALDRWMVADENGAFVFKGLAAGRYRVEITQLGYRSHQGEIRVLADSTLLFELWPDPVVLEGLSAQVDRLKRRRNAIAAVVHTSDRARLATAIDVESAIRGMGETVLYCGSGQLCLMRRGRPVLPRVYIDERPAFGLDELRAYQPWEFHTIEVIGHAQIRAYTLGFMERLALGKASLFPVLF